MVLLGPRLSFSRTVVLRYRMHLESRHLAPCTIKLRLVAGNCELDAMIENDEFASQMEDQYVSDLSNPTEVMLDVRRRVRAPGEPLHRVGAECPTRKSSH